VKPSLRLAVVFVGSAAAAGAMPGCLAAMIMAESRKADMRVQDRAAFHEHNLERTKAGLPMVTWEEWQQVEPEVEPGPGAPAEDFE
jgi:hypothetical protein